MTNHRGEKEKYGICAMCRRPGKKMQLHHIITKENNGSNGKDNMLVLCVLCHDLVHGDASYDDNNADFRRWLFHEMMEKPAPMWVMLLWLKMSLFVTSDFKTKDLPIAELLNRATDFSHAPSHWSEETKLAAAFGGHDYSRKPKPFVTDWFSKKREKRVK